MQSARKSGPDDNIDDFLGYIEIPVKVHTVQHSICNKVTQQAKLLKKGRKNALKPFLYLRHLQTSFCMSV